LEKFFALPEAKQKAIIDAAHMIFGKVGYKKASANDIATAAGISKGMIFHYFGSKKRMYLYLVELAMQSITEAFSSAYDKPVSDFFDRVLVGTQIKLSLIQRYPALFSFLVSAYFETDLEVTEEIQAFLKKGESFRNDFALTKLDTAKFKENVKPELVLNILVKFTEGYVRTTTIDHSLDLDPLMREFTECLHLMKNNFYKEEYL
jgi:TetR/AcrR family transcriptional regulator